MSNSETCRVETLPAAADEPAAEPQRAWMWKLPLFMTLAGCVMFTARQLGVRDYFTPERVTALRAELGGWSLILLLLAAAFRDFLRLPAPAAVAAAVLGYGHLLGGLLAFIGLSLSVIISFASTRFITGKPLPQIERALVKRPKLQRILERIENRPILTTFALRHVFNCATVLNIAMGMSGIRTRDYVIGSVAGLIIPTTLTVCFLSWFLDLS